MGVILDVLESWLVQLFHHTNTQISPGTHRVTSVILKNRKGRRIQPTGKRNANGFSVKQAEIKR
jgi:hypothetical protein